MKNCCVGVSATPAVPTTRTQITQIRGYLCVCMWCTWL